LEHSACFHIKPDSTDGYEIDGGSKHENISDLFDRILAPYKVKREKLIPQYDNCMPRRHLYEIFADRPRSPKKLTIMAISVVEF
jgi:hypothetical protein